MAHGLDRSDNANLDKVMQISINTYRWTAFAFNGLTNRTTYKGSTLFFNQPTRLGQGHGLRQRLLRHGLLPADGRYAHRQG